MTSDAGSSRHYLKLKLKTNLYSATKSGDSEALNQVRRGHRSIAGMDAGEMQAITALCLFQCDVAKVCSTSSVCFGCLSR